jgi:hypothetical protein
MVQFKTVVKAQGEECDMAFVDFSSVDHPVSHGDQNDHVIAALERVGLLFIY